MRHSVLRLASALLIAAGIVLLGWPVASQWWAAQEASRGIAAVTAVYDDMNGPDRMDLRDEARRYNLLLADGGDLSSCAPYGEQLSFEGSEMIAYISIPSIAVKLPIYHGTEDKALMAGVGHLADSSLPVGGESSHCVLTAHTGAPGMRMFDDIDLLKPGDEFVLHVLGEALAYRVTGAEVVLPDQTDSLRIVPGEDLCTLVTCTPYRVNTHRLLVHAERCPYSELEGDASDDSALYVNRRTLPYLAGLAVLVAVVGVLAFHAASRREAPTVARLRSP